MRPRPALGDMVLAYLCAPLIGGLLAGLLMVPVLLAVWKEPYEFTLICFTITSITLGICLFAYKGLLLVVPLSLAMRAAGFTARWHWLLLGLGTAHLTGYGELYEGEGATWGTAGIAAMVSVAGITCGYAFWLLVSYWPQRDAQAR